MAFDGLLVLQLGFGEFVLGLQQFRQNSIEFLGIVFDFSEVGFVSLSHAFFLSHQQIQLFADMLQKQTVDLLLLLLSVGKLLLELFLPPSERFQILVVYLA